MQISHFLTNLEKSCLSNQINILTQIFAYGLKSYQMGIRGLERDNLMQGHRDRGWEGQSGYSRVQHGHFMVMDYINIQVLQARTTSI